MKVQFEVRKVHIYVRKLNLMMILLRSFSQKNIAVLNYFQRELIKTFVIDYIKDLREEIVFDIPLLFNVMQRGYEWM